MQGTYHLRLLGSIQIEAASGSMQPIESRKASGLMGYLIRQRQPVARSTLANLFWGDKSESRARSNLSRELSLLTTRLPSCFQADYHYVQWAPTVAVSVDLADFQRLSANRTAAQVSEYAVEQMKLSSDSWFVQHAKAGLQPAPLEAAVDLYRGEFMAGFYLDGCPEFDTWLVGEREGWRLCVTELLEQLIAYHALRHADEQALAHARRWLTLEPWHEGAHQYVLVLLARNGRRSDALSHYETLRHILNHELAVEPAEETVVLYNDIRAGALEREGAQLRSDARIVTQPLAWRADLPPAHPARPAESQRLYDWGERPSDGMLYGRNAELTKLNEWLIGDHCRLVILVGIAGSGKTALVAKLTTQVADRFDVVIWRSLGNAPPLTEILRVLLQCLSAQRPVELPDSLDERLMLLNNYLHRQRCLIVLDNVEGIFQSGVRAGTYRDGYENYGQLIRCLEEGDHQSCLVVISREQLQTLAYLDSKTTRTRCLELRGLDLEASQSLLRANELTVTLDTGARLVRQYAGNPFALKLVVGTIREFFGGDIAAFLQEDVLIFDSIRDVCDQQLARLSPQEHEFVLCLADADTRLSFQALWQRLVHARPRAVVLETLQSLRRRSLLEKHADGFALQSIVRRYVAECLADSEAPVHGSRRNEMTTV